MNKLKTHTCFDLQETFFNVLEQSCTFVEQNVLTDLQTINRQQSFELLLFFKIKESRSCSCSETRDLSTPK